MTDSDVITCSARQLTSAEQLRLDHQNSRLVSDFKAEQLEKNARKFWDLFYKRNENRFFKDRHWTTREFKELLNNESSEQRVLLEIGCGVGNFIYPLLEDNLNFNIIACDLSERAVEIVRNHTLYDEKKIRVFQCDITSEDILQNVDEDAVEIATLIFVLSSIHPEKFVSTLKMVHRLLRPGGILLFRDYGLHDMAQLRFKAGHKIGENFYMRQDGTRSYYFSVEFLREICLKAGFVTITLDYIHRRTVNKKENIDVPRIFIQAKLVKPT